MVHDRLDLAKKNFLILLEQFFFKSHAAKSPNLNDLKKEKKKKDGACSEKNNRKKSDLVIQI